MMIFPGSNVIGEQRHGTSRQMSMIVGGSILKKNGSIDTGMGVTLFRPNKICVVKFALRWNATPFGKLALSGVLFAQNTP